MLRRSARVLFRPSRPSPKASGFQRFKDWCADLVQNRRSELFFALIATFALSQVGYREFKLKQRMENQKEKTPQRSARTKIGEAPEGSPKSRWEEKKARRKERKEQRKREMEEEREKERRED